MEEKQTDVNIALHMYRDAIRGDVDAVVLCSNDSDLEPVLAMIRQDCPHVTVGLVLPRNANNPNARKSGKLERHVHWVRHHIQDSELVDSQLPERILDHRNRSIRKPDAW